MGDMIIFVIIFIIKTRNLSIYLEEGTFLEGSPSLFMWW